MKIQFLLDNPNSWMVPYAKEFVTELIKQGFDASLIHSHDISSGDILILLSCEKKFNQLEKNKHNLVIHASDLPEGKGWSPLTYQILSGKNEIPVTLFEANEKIDGGNIYLKDVLVLDGDELIEEIRKKLTLVMFNLIRTFLEKADKIKGVPQHNNGSYYPKRTQNDSKLDLDVPLRNQFNLLRVVDNERYPAFFEYKGQKYVLKIFKNNNI